MAHARGMLILGTSSVEVAKQKSAKDSAPRGLHACANFERQRDRAFHLTVKWKRLRYLRVMFSDGDQSTAIRHRGHGKESMEVPSY